MTRTTEIAEVPGQRGRSAGEVLLWSRDVVVPALRAAVDQLPASMRDIAAYHLGWRDAQGRVDSADGGKTLRPALVLLAARAAGGDVANALPAAVAVELVHNFSLLHDDVMDGDETRRHRPTAWTVFGANAAVLAGDALQTLALEVLATSGHPALLDQVRVLNAAVLDLLDGQSADLAFEDRTDVVLAECVAMAEYKTGALLGGCCALGALAAGADPDRVRHLRGFGARLGLAFQLVDDLLGIWGDPEVTGKPVFSDLQNRKKSLPVVAALSSHTAAARELDALYRSDEVLTETDLARAAELIDVAGGRRWARTKADEQLSLAAEHLRVAGAEPVAAAELMELAKLVTRRDR
ncbi:family 2 encapsulin nanocompartment cargo protein polyprenyl transferase [Umezawaea beigongshangensis]|uniref:family 2 encapsulin nanocompartment cargo protein polyprenyl transferase n=1 Tax=Umezawaea beigongshangensis TaxID=2780383 RepID=UPI0027DC49E9|nr:family 2 encapsulin nanocompartment cargo protein polyprenyl transferase [Umezawaea beigongshangensis]